MSHSTSRPCGKWYESGRHFLFGFPRYTDAEMDLMRAEIEQDEQERLRAADMMAKRFVDEFWPEIAVTILPPMNGFSSWDVIKHRYDRRDELVAMMQEFWRQRV